MSTIKNDIVAALSVKNPPTPILVGKRRGGRMPMRTVLMRQSHASIAALPCTRYCSSHTLICGCGGRCSRGGPGGRNISTCHWRNENDCECDELGIEVADALGLESDDDSDRTRQQRGKRRGKEIKENGRIADFSTFVERKEHIPKLIKKTTTESLTRLMRMKKISTVLFASVGTMLLASYTSTLLSKKPYSAAALCSTGVVNIGKMVLAAAIGRIKQMVSLRLVLASFLGGVVGRGIHHNEKKGRGRRSHDHEDDHLMQQQSYTPCAGARTFALVALGACTFTLCGTHGFAKFVLEQQRLQQLAQQQQMQLAAFTDSIAVSKTMMSSTAAAPFSVPPMTTTTTSLSVDVSRMASSVATGVGFIGAGVISRGNNDFSQEGSNRRQASGDVRGLTTAASIWVSAAVGISCAVGMYAPAICATAATVAVARLGDKLLPMCGQTTVPLPQLQVSHYTVSSDGHRNQQDGEEVMEDRIGQKAERRGRRRTTTTFRPHDDVLRQRESRSRRQQPKRALTRTMQQWQPYPNNSTITSDHTPLKEAMIDHTTLLSSEEEVLMDAISETVLPNCASKIISLSSSPRGAKVLEEIKK